MIIEMHAQISGTIDFREPDDEACLLRLRSLAEQLPEDSPQAPFRRNAGSRGPDPSQDPSGSLIAGATQAPKRDCSTPSNSSRERTIRSTECSIIRLTTSSAKRRRQSVKSPMTGRPIPTA